MTTSSLRLAILAGGCALALAGCGETARQSVEAGMGPNPNIVSPAKTLIPTVKVADAVGWPAGAVPTAAAGLKVAPFVTGLDHPRWLLVLPNGDVLVAETNAPPKPEDGKGIRAKFMAFFMKKAGADVGSPNRISLLRDADGDGTAEMKTVLLSNL
jgi:glucose/arabinose dehydrogenase